MTVGHTDRAHALLSASSAHRWLACTRSATFESDFPDTTSEAAKEGTLAHEICEVKVKHYFHLDGIDTDRKKSTRINKLKKEPLYQSEMDGYTDTYLDFIKTAALACSAKPYIAVEQRLDLTGYIPDGFGTADCIMISGSTLHIMDFKYGKGVKVDAENNAQMMLYALGAYEAYKIAYSITDINMGIIQPRIDSVSTASCSIESLIAWGEYVKPIALEAYEGKGDFTPGDIQCRFCRGKAACRARADKNIELLSKTAVVKPDRIDAAAIGVYLQQGADVAQWLKDLQDYALSLCLKGEYVPGWKAVCGRGSREWLDMDKAFEALEAQGIPEAMLYERRPLTLAQVEKTVGKACFDSTVGDLVVKRAGKPTLVPETDKREAFKPTSAAEAFGTASSVE